jgi:hypothetical protein
MRAKRRLAAPIVVTLAGLPGCVNGERSAAPPAPVAAAAHAPAPIALTPDASTLDATVDAATPVTGDLDPDPPPPVFDADASQPIGPIGEIRRTHDGWCKQYLAIDCTHAHGAPGDPMDPCNPPGPYSAIVLVDFACDAGAGSDSSQ